MHEQWEDLKQTIKWTSHFGQCYISR